MVGLVRRRWAAAVGAALVACALARGDEPDLAGWLAEVDGGVGRARADVVRWREAEVDLLGIALARASDAARPLEERRGAARVLGVAADEADVAGALRRLAASDAALAPAAQAAASRIERRVRLLDGLARAARDPARAEQVARSPPDRVEVLALVEDPLLATELRRAAVGALHGAGDLAEAGLLVAVASDATTPAEVSRACLAALVARGDIRQVGGLLGRLLARGDDAARALEADAAAALAAAQALAPTARRLLRERTVPLAGKARLASLLGRRGVDSVRPAIARLLDADGLTRREQSAVVLALLDLGADCQPHERRLLTDALDPDPGLAAAAAAALLAHRPPGLGLHLRDVFAAPDAGGRRLRAVHLIEALELRDASSLELLGELPGDDAIPLGVRQAALHALGSLGGSRAVWLLTRALATPAGAPEEAALRREAADGLAACVPVGDVARRALEGALLDPEACVRRAALRGLAAEGDVRCREAVVVYLGSRREVALPERLARFDACARLGLFDAEVAALVLPAPSVALRDLALAVAALEFARRVEAGVAVPTLLALLEHRSPRVAAEALLELWRRYPSGRSFGDDLSAGEARRRLLARWRQAFAERPGEFR